MKPYYDHAGITIYHGDCREILPEIKADVVVTDPPYGIKDKPMLDLPGGRRARGKKSSNNTYHPETTWDDEINPEWAKAVCSASETIAWFGQWRKREEVESTMTLPLRCEIIWAKDCHVGPPCPLAMRDERIWVFSKHGIKGQRFETTVWDEPIIPTWKFKHHKNEKPLQLMSRLISWLSSEDQLILDPFMGSGTTLRAAKDLGRKAIGIEIEERYCEIAAKRLAQEVLF